MWTLCLEDGSSLSLAGDLRWVEELQGISVVSGVYDNLLLGLLYTDIDMVMGRSMER